MVIRVSQIWIHKSGSGSASLFFHSVIYNSVPLLYFTLHNCGMSSLFRVQRILPRIRFPSKVRGSRFENIPRDKKWKHAMSSTPKERCCSRTASAACRDKLYASAPNRYHIPTVVAVLFLGGSEDSVPFVLGWSEWLYRIYTVILFDSYIYYVFIYYLFWNLFVHQLLIFSVVLLF